MGGGWWTVRAVFSRARLVHFTGNPIKNGGATSCRNFSKDHGVHVMLC